MTLNLDLSEPCFCIHFSKNDFVDCWDRTDKQGIIFALAPLLLRGQQNGYGIRVVMEE